MNNWMNISQTLSLENVDKIFNTYGRIASTVSFHKVNKQSTWCIYNIRTNPSQPGILRAPKSPPRIWSRFPASTLLLPLFSCSLGWSHACSFFSSNPKQSSSFAIALFQLEELLSSLHILVTSQMSPPQKDVPEFLSEASRLLPHTYSLFRSYLLFSSSNISKKKKKRFLSPETGFIRLAHITHHWVIKWPEGGELGTWFPVHLLHWKSCVAWSRVSFINWGLGFWHPELSIPTQLPVHSDMTLLVLCVHQHKFTISGYAFQEEKITLLYIPRTYLKDPSILQQETSAVSTPTHFQLFTSKSLPCCVHQL